MTVSYPTATEAKLISAAEKVMEEVMSRYDPSHDAYHARRVRKIALHIAQTLAQDSRVQTPDLLVVELAALFHDTLDKKYVSAEEASDPYRFFTPFFRDVAKDTGIDLLGDGRGKLIADIVSNVSWTTENKLRAAGKLTEWHQHCVELHCVQDADRLDAIGAFGILRCSAFSTRVNRPLHTATVDDTAAKDTAVAVFRNRLLPVRERLWTEEGKRLGEKRCKIITQFLEAIDDEYEVRA